GAQARDLSVATLQRRIDLSEFSPELWSGRETQDVESAATPNDFGLFQILQRMIPKLPAQSKVRQLNVEGDPCSAGGQGASKDISHATMPCQAADRFGDTSHHDGSSMVTFFK